MPRAERSYLFSGILLVLLTLLSQACDYRLPKGVRLLDRAAVAESILLAKATDPGSDAGFLDGAYAGTPLRELSDDLIRTAVARWEGRLIFDTGVEVHTFEMRLARPGLPPRTWRGTAYRRGDRVNLHVQHEDGKLLDEFRVWSGSRDGATFRFRLGLFELVF